jgi:hypothetical protein
MMTAHTYTSISRQCRHIAVSRCQWRDGGVARVLLVCPNDPPQERATELGALPSRTVERAQHERGRI